VLMGHLGDARAIIVDERGGIEYTTKDHRPW
jgi:serine/threonine protein phosphatase PrpC